MSKNKFWNKDTEAKTVEQTEIKETNLEVEASGESFVSDIQLEMMKQAKLGGIETVLDILYNYPKSMMDDAYSIDTRLVADWVKTKLKQKGYKV